ncbi:MAG: hypothetical protein ABIP95_09535 [Pelobium sp.]
MKKLFTSLAFVLLFVIVCFAADLNGTFKGIISLGNQDLELTYKLKAEGEKLTGTITSSYGDLPVLDGKISGNDFSYKIEIGNGEPMLSTGEFMGDSIVVSSKIGGREVKNTFKRVAD